MNALALALALAAQPVCPGPNCPAPAPEWRQAKHHEMHLYVGGSVVGGYDGTEYRRWDGRDWSEPCQSPVPLPKFEALPAPKFGVDLSRIKEAPAYSMSGVAVSGAAAHEATGGGALSDDTAKPWVIVRTDDPKLGDEICSGLAPLAESFRIMRYPPGHWALTSVNADRGLVTVMAPDGKELHRQDDLQGGVPAVVDAVRKADPKYDPSKTPDLRKSSPAVDGLKQWLSSTVTLGGYAAPVWLLIVAAVALFLFLRSRRK